ncbi:putative TetR family transcriptional regulator [Gordonia effusa NBRC 100432]|uniref:Putative TetR family transcriptional regulator n=2 Tax=Gordonia effusa TaxID=263908 RepID=H0R2C8_9ACTN|nr:putative TetR family transcriptional regulator [Gordonia effusa NBRC 100432]
MRGAEDAAGVPHGTARHHFNNQNGLVAAMVEHLLAIDTPAEGESVQQQVDRWLGTEADFTRARYELMVAAFHDSVLADKLTQSRDRLLSVLVHRGHDPSAAHHMGVALDGLVLDALLRRSLDADSGSLQARFVDPVTPC